LFFFAKEALVQDVIPGKPLGVLFLTSLRDIALEEYNGQKILVDGNFQYMEGVIERTKKETRHGGILHGLVEVRGVIVDDTEEDLKGNFPLLPENGGPWIFPLDLGIPVWNIPSHFRELPKQNIDSRKIAKLTFEKKVLEKANEIGVDIIISDSYMAIIEYLIGTLGMYGKVLNIHPGPTLLDEPFCFRGANPVGDAIAFARQQNSPVYTGATLHFVNTNIDDGKPIAYICKTEVSSEDSELVLTYRNYINAKLPLFISGLKHYVMNVFPYMYK
jgi:folate-dependent phosphoribosylglycinamide formyltransferase PurN